ncbi:cytochrome P450 [Russula brevipes]|nr:cytochrome P450 [Russula brevipes]
MQLPLTINAIDCFAATLFLYLGLPYPPGPPSRPIIGNLLDVPKHSPWVAYADTSKKYGDIFCLRVFGQVVVVLCSLPAIKGLLEERGEAYADRPRMPILEILHLDWLLPTAMKSQSWREGRKLLDRSLRSSAILPYRQMMQESTRGFLVRLLVTPKDFRDHIKFLQGKLIMSLTYGYDLKEYDDMIAAPVEASKIMSQLLLPGAALVNHFPILRYIPSWVPWLSYEPLARLGRELSEKMKNKPIDFVKDAMRKGTAVQSLASEHLQSIEALLGLERQKQEEIVKVTLGSIFTGKSPYSRTRYTVSAMASLFLALVLYPEAQARAQAELDAVLGRDRLPRLPHLSSQDDVYKGFFIPKGLVRLSSTLRQLTRHLSDDPALALAFGVGKRICPGRHLVDATLFIVASSVLSVFNVTKARDESDHEIPVNVTMSVQSGIVVHPEKFECAITPRDKLAEDLISANALS